jgi:hypothetical protein
MGRLLMVSALAPVYYTTEDWAVVLSGNHCLRMLQWRRTDTILRRC